MKVIALLVTLLCFGGQSNADEIIKIEIGSEKAKYSQSDLQKRVWMLERAVWQLQKRVIELEAAQEKEKEKKESNTWGCIIEAMGGVYSATGATRAVAEANVIAACKKERGDSFFCKDAKCNQ